ncbi:mCG145520, partial [Mus musculus]
LCCLTLEPFSPTRLPCLALLEEEVPSLTATWPYASGPDWNSHAMCRRQHFKALLSMFLNSKSVHSFFHDVPRFGAAI